MITLDSKFNIGNHSYGQVRFLLDTPDDLPNLKNTYAPGSRAFVISTSDEYMLNNQSKWVKIKKSSSSGGGGDTPDPDNTYIYDGGEIL